MKKTILTILLNLYVTLHACNKSSEYFIGKWQILSVVENNESIDLIENWMLLKTDGTFESYDGNLKKHESGKWIYQASTKTLLIEGETESGDSRWNLSISNDTLIFRSPTSDLHLISKKIK